MFNREIEINEDFEETHSSNSVIENPYLTTHVNIMVAKVKEAIERLPDNLKSIFVLFEINGMKYREISATLDLPINTVKVYLLRARKKLQEELKEYEAHEII